MSIASSFEKRAGRTIAQILSPSGRRARLVVFCYHQVLVEKDPMRSAEPTLVEFEADIDRISAWFNVLSLPDAAEALSNDKLPARSACITFDDGYLNNYELAAPALSARGLPATFFVTTGALEQGIMWNDLVIDGVAGASAPLVMTALGAHMPSITTDAPAHVIAQHIIDAIKYVPLTERWAIAEGFYRDNVDGNLPRKMMHARHVSELANRGFDIGAHTVSHPILEKLTDESAREEIRASLRWVSDVTGRAPRSFAYPNGRPGIDFEPVHTEQVREAGCSVAVSTDWALGRRGTNRYSMPRVGPWWRQGRNSISGLFRTYIRSWLD